MIEKIGELKWKKSQQKRLVILKNYIVASINLYGVIKVDDLLSIISMYESETYTKDEVIQVAELLATIECTGISFKQNIISCGLYELSDLDDFYNVKRLLQIQSTKPRYIPSKQEFLRYQSESYIEPIETIKRIPKNDL